jgi:hypothetical protein
MRWWNVTQMNTFDIQLMENVSKNDEATLSNIINQDEDINYLGYFAGLYSFCTVTNTKFNALINHECLLPIKIRGKYVYVINPFGNVQSSHITKLFMYMNTFTTQFSITHIGEKKFDSIQDKVKNIGKKLNAKVGTSKVEIPILSAKKIFALEGKEFVNLRRKINKFKKNNIIMIQSMASDNKHDAYYILDKWKEKDIERKGKDMLLSINQYKNLIEYYADSLQGKGSDFFSFIVYVDDNPEGLVFCHKTNSDVFTSSITMGNVGIEGLNEYLYYQLSEFALEYGWDLFNPGEALNKGQEVFKKKFKPVKFINQYSIKIDMGTGIEEREPEEYF